MTPSLCASAADSGLPVKNISYAIPVPARRWRSQLTPPSGASPMFTNASSRYDSGVAIRMSHARAKLAPMPIAGPFIAAITGFGIVRRRVSIGMYSLRRTLPTSSGVRMPAPCTISVTSAPEQKARPEPVSTTTRIASSRSACLMASASCWRVSAPMAFIFSGLLSRIRPMPSCV